MYDVRCVDVKKTGKEREVVVLSLKIEFQLIERRRRRLRRQRFLPPFVSLYFFLISMWKSFKWSEYRPNDGKRIHRNFRVNVKVKQKKIQMKNKKIFHFCLVRLKRFYRYMGSTASSSSSFLRAWFNQYRNARALNPLSMRLSVVIIYGFVPFS